MENALLSGLTLPGIAALGKKNIEELTRVQLDLLSTMQDVHGRWFERMRSEATLASEFTRKVTSCRSIPDAVAVCREWTGRQLEMMADDSKQLLTDSQKVMERSARLLSDGLFAKAVGGADTEAEASPLANSAAEPASRSPPSRSDVAWK
jgi:hypothetical protein